MEMQLLLKPPRDPHKRLIWSSASSFLTVSIIVPLLGAFISLYEGMGLWSFPEGIVMWGLTLLLMVANALFGQRIRRPAIFYLVERLPGIPMGLVFLDGGMRLIAVILGIRSLLLIVVGLLVGLGTLPWTIRDERAKFRRALKDGYLVRSLDPKSYSWDPQYDIDRWEKDERITKPGFFRRLLFWIGPALGMALSDLIGRSPAQVVVGLGFIYIGYFLLGSSIRSAVSKVLELNRIEEELGQEIYLERK